VYQSINQMNGCMHEGKRVQLHVSSYTDQHLYSAPSRYLLRGAPDPGQAEKNSL